MVAIQITSSPSFRDVGGRFAKAEKAILEERRNQLRIEGPKLVQYAKEEAPKKTGKFREGIRWNTRTVGDSLRLRVTVPQPLGTYIEKGTKKHRIYPKNANALVFPWLKVGMLTVVPKGGGFRTHVRKGTLWVGKGYVDHPGTKPNPFLKRALTRWRPNGYKVLRQISSRFKTEITK